MAQVLTKPCASLSRSMNHIELGLGRLEELEGLGELGESVFLYVSDHAQQIQHNEQLNTAWT